MIPGGSATETALSLIYVGITYSWSKYNSHLQLMWLQLDVFCVVNMLMFSMCKVIMGCVGDIDFDYTNDFLFNNYVM